MSNTKKAKPAIEGVVVDTPFEAEAAEVEDETPAFEMFGERWLLLRQPTTLHMSRLASVSKTSPAAIAVFDQLIDWCLRDQAEDFRAAYFDAVPDDGNDGDMVGDVIGALVSGGTGRPPA